MFWEKHRKKIIIALLIAIAGIPFIIHVVFKIHPSNPFFSAEWTAGEFLGFYGVLLGAAATVIGVFLTVSYAQKNYREDVINRSIPFLTITPLKDDQCLNGAMYFIIKNGEVSTANCLSDIQIQNIQNKGIVRETITTGVSSKIYLKMLHLPLKIENVGNGAAVTFSVGLNPMGITKKMQRFTLPTSISKGGSFLMAIYSENLDNMNCGDYSLCLSYYDILGNAYEQNLLYSINSNSFNTEVTGALKLDGTQKRLRNADRTEERNDHNDRNSSTP